MKPDHAIRRFVGGECTRQAVLVRLARHERRIVVEIRESKDAAPARHEQQAAQRIKRTELVELVVRRLAHEQREVGGTRRSGPNAP